MQVIWNYIDTMSFPLFILVMIAIALVVLLLVYIVGIALEQTSTKDHTELKEYIQIYKERYPRGGPSWSSQCGRTPWKRFFQISCGCWKCSLIELRKWKNETERIKKYGPNHGTNHGTDRTFL